ncbi:DUF4373 domain-containing protein [Candidatus Dojkabacteria bacterium]|jgi:hypothetical protein|nr:DUF4373 domain-containing protein [Candidatus Dojkabacteria bacterium]
MKWFKHFSDSYSNLKLRIVKKEYGSQGYGVYWLCLELVAQQGGLNFELSSHKQWKKVLEFETNLSTEELDKILTLFSDLDLIDSDAFKRGSLKIPKMLEYCDEYREKLGRKSRSPDVIPTGRDVVGLEEEEIRREEEGDPDVVSKGRDNLPLGDGLDKNSEWISGGTIPYRFNPKDQVDQLIKIFYDNNPLAVDPTSQKIRRAAIDVINAKTFKDAMVAAKYAIEVRGKEFAPTISDTVQLKEKYEMLLDFKFRKK